MALASEEICPVPETLLGQLYRSSPEGVDVLVRTVPPSTRAMLSYYCSRRSHLESLGLAIAATCSQEDLYDVAGRAGHELFTRARSEASKLAEPIRRKSRQGVTLASGPLWNIPRLSD